MFTRIKDNYQFFILCILCAIFVIIKLPDLKLPFFWDESWVYAPAIKTMAQNGLGLLPDALADSYSRGHPLLFFFTGSLWVKLFGGSFFSLHSFALVIAISFIFTLYFIVRKIFDTSNALMISVITLAQPIFFAQAGLALPEIFLALWAILSIYHFVKKNWFFYFLFGTLMLLTKESGAIIIASLMLYQTICFFSQKVTFQTLKVFLTNSFIAFTPMISFIGFLLIQHHQRGYYFFPEHIAMLNYNWHEFQEKLKHCYDIIFEGQGRKYLTWSFIVFFAFLYKPVPVFIRVTIIIGLMTCVKVFFRYWALPDWLMITYIGLFTGALYYVMHIKYAPKVEGTNKILAVIFIIGILYMVFSSINFFTNRYLFILIPLMISYFVYYIKASLQYRPYLPYLWAIVLISIIIYNTITNYNTTGDDSPKYVDAIKLELNMVKYLEEQNLQKNNIYCNFTMNVALNGKAIGFLSGNSVFTNVNGQLNNATEYVIYTNIDYDPKWDKGSDTLSHFQILKKFDYGVAHGKVFKRIL
jgi:hypothetical protein